MELVYRHEAHPPEPPVALGPAGADGDLLRRAATEPFVQLPRRWWDALEDGRLTPQSFVLGTLIAGRARYYDDFSCAIPVGELGRLSGFKSDTLHRHLALLRPNWIDYEMTKGQRKPIAFRLTGLAVRRPHLRIAQAPDADVEAHLRTKAGQDAEVTSALTSAPTSVPSASRSATNADEKWEPVTAEPSTERAQEPPYAAPPRREGAVEETRPVPSPSHKRPGGAGRVLTEVRGKRVADDGAGAGARADETQLNKHPAAHGHGSGPVRERAALHAPRGTPAAGIDARVPTDDVTLSRIDIAAVFQAAEHAQAQRRRRLGSD